MKIQHRTLLFAATASLLLAAIPVSAEVRTWTDTQGRSVEAEFLGTEGAGPSTVVKLKRADGQTFNFPIANLSEADRLFVASHLPKDPAALANEVDKLVLNKLKESYYDLQKQLAALPQRTDLDAELKKKEEEKIKREMEMCIPNELTSDEQFLRRIYLDIAGRIPTYKEAEKFLSDSNRNKRAALIDELLNSEAFAMHMFNFYGDLLRIREGLTMMGGGDLRADPYIEWVKQAVRENKPFNAMVKEMLTAQGNVWDTPAAGYLMTDDGMRLCNLSNTFTVFLGTEITCAQCHDHPFEEIYQMDFFRLASFMGGTETRGGRGGNMMIMGGADPRGEIDRLSKILKDGGKLGERETRDRQLEDIFGSFSYNVNDRDGNAVKLPHDYKYDDGEPNGNVEPGAYFGDAVNLEKYKTPREAYADWMTSPSNPRFTINLVNRLWKKCFGVAQIEPVFNIPGHLDGQAQNYELLTFLEQMMKDLNFSVKDFLRVVYNTQTYQREAESLSPSLDQMDKGTYHFPGPVLRRMSAEQMWDSLVTLTTPDPDAVVRRGWEAYKELMHTDTKTLTTVDQIMKFKEDFGKIGGLASSDGEMMMGGSGPQVGGVQMVRASEMRQPMPPGHFLRMFGQSDKQLIENQFTTGSSPQVMALLNGNITNQVLTSPDSFLLKEVAAAGRGDRVEQLFLAILSRRPSASEKSAATAGMRPERSEDDKEKAAIKGLGNVVWALVNTREFMFIQ
ncbi:MAG: DUF1549 domain-containing protein [Verrucomicrobiales bacterium]|nr:DUF1549 domain-containing protein [Verrucomicrobiales bacterium]